MEIKSILNQIENECKTAAEQYPEFHSAHEGYGVLTEEYRELETEIFKRSSKRDLTLMRKEAIQVAAMAVRLIHDVIDKGNNV